MLFNSIPFLLLFFFTYIIYWNIDNKYRKYLLIVSSILFYSYFSLLSGIHFLSIIYINYIFSNKLLQKRESVDKGKNTLIAIILINIINLGFFKYYYFFTGLFFDITGFGIFHKASTAIHILLPLAISFYTFQLIAVQMDIYRGKITDRIHAVDYFLFILFFPQLVAGPIMRTTDFLYQIDKPSISSESLQRGILMLIMGLFKKIVVSDSIGSIIAPIYKSPSSYDSLSLYISTFSFASQVYCDFSGYTDIAIGLALLLGYNIPDNFKGPFLSSSYREYWTRWHITLSTWLRDYLYIPLGGSRLGEFRANLNMLITMSLGGLWHGADINFFVWGFYLGILLWGERILEKLGWINPNPKGIHRVMKTTIVTFLFMLSGIFFRCGIEAKNSFHNSMLIFKGMFTFQVGNRLPRLEELYVFLFLTLIFNAIQYKESFSPKLATIMYKLIPVLSFLLLMFLGVFGDGGGDFIYFQF